jgi:hypothetical protein
LENQIKLSPPKFKEIPELKEAELSAKIHLGESLV